MNKFLIILIGNIASGKSTLAKELDDAGFLVVSSDSIRYMLHPNEYKFKLHEEPIVYAIKIAAIKAIAKQGLSFVVDDAGNVFKRKRKIYVDIARKFGYELIAVHMPHISKKEAVKRRLKNNHGGYDSKKWGEVYDMFKDNLELPTIEEGFNKIIDKEADKPLGGSYASKR